MKFKNILILSALVFLNASCATYKSKVKNDIELYESTLIQMKKEFSAIPQNPKDKEWVKLKLDNMFKIDQFMRSYWDTPFKKNYLADEKIEFQKLFTHKFEEIDLANTADLKELLKHYQWFKISEFGIVADNQAWIIVQHADKDPGFQMQVLLILEKLWPKGETKPANYAYLYDRLASSFSDQTKMVPQRYGTQGRCIGPATWEPFPIEDIANVDKRRKTVGLSTMAEYKAIFKDICH